MELELLFTIKFRWGHSHTYDLPLQRSIFNSKKGWLHKTSSEQQNSKGPYFSIRNWRWLSTCSRQMLQARCPMQVSLLNLLI